METFKYFLLKYKHACLLLYMLIYIPWFMYLEKTVTRRYHVIHMRIDDYIPFVEYFIIPYIFWFFYVAIAIVYFFFMNVKDYYKLCFFLFSGMTIFLLISTIFPNGHTLRPLFYPNNNIFVMMVKQLHLTDTPTNIFPSIHVYNSIGVHLAVINNEKLKQTKLVRIISFLLMFSIILSTVFLKQHSVLDIIGAFIFTGLFYPLIYVVDWQKYHHKAYNEQIS